MIRFLGRYPSINRDPLYRKNLPCKTFSTTQVPRHPDNKKKSFKNAKRFSAVPGPRRLPVIGNLHLFSKFGPYSFERPYDAYKDLHKKYGPLVRLDLGGPMLLVFTPADITQVHLKNANRPTLEPLEQYRLKRKDKYSCAGLIAGNGEDWFRLHSAVKFLDDARYWFDWVSPYTQIAEDLVCLMEKKRDEKGFIPDLQNALYRYTAEVAGFMCFGKRLGLLSLNSAEAEDLSNQIIQASEDSLKSLYDIRRKFPWWKIFPTPTYRTIVRTQEFFYNFCAECVKEAEFKIKDPAYKGDGSLCVLRTLFKDKTLKPGDINLIMTDLFSSAINLTGDVIGLVLYNLAKNPDAQNGLLALIEYQPNIAPRYAGACLYETFRLNHPSIGTVRRLAEPKVLSGYLIPKDVVCVCMQPLLTDQEEYFDDPLKYDPQTWLPGAVKKDPDLYYPTIMAAFGRLTRRCLGGWLATLEIKECIIKIVEKYHVEYDGPELGDNNYIDKPVNFRFIHHKKRRYQP